MDSQKPHFYKILLGLGIQLSILRFPRNFIRKLGEIASPVQLKVADGCMFQVEVERKGGELCMVKWRQFAEQYSLKHGHFLLFEYQGGSIFRVFIFDPSATEIEYGNFNQEAEAENSGERLNESNQEAGDSQYNNSAEMGVGRSNHIIQEEEADEDNDSVEILNETPRESKTERKCLGRSKRRKTASDKNKNVSEDVSSDEGDKRNSNSTRLQKAAAFQTDNPTFVVEMQPSYINPGYKLILPIDFIKYLPNKTGNVTLCTMDGKKWNARYFGYKTNNKYTRANIFQGWREFMQDNQLKPGDVCVFELTNHSNITLNVIIYRINQDSNCSSFSGRILKCNESCCSMLPLKSHEKATALLRAKDFDSDYPYFKVVMQPAYLGRGRWRLYIPNKFVKENMDVKKNKVILQVSNGKTWEVDFAVLAVPSGQQKPQFCGENWRKFVEHNKLHVGDVCAFELIDHTNEGDSIFKVSIFS